MVLVSKINSLLASGFVCNKKNIEYDQACPSHGHQWSLHGLTNPSFLKTNRFDIVVGVGSEEYKA